MKNLFLPIAFLLASSVLSAQGDFAKGISFYKQGQYQKAIEQFEPLVEENPDYEAGFRVLGDCYLQLKQYSKAASAFRKAMELDGDQFVSHYGLAVAHFNQGQHRDAIAALIRAERLAKAPREQYQLAQLRGSAYYNIEDYAKAIEDLQKAASIQRGDFNDILQLGISYYRTGNYEQARQRLEQAASLNPSSGEPMRFLARLDYQNALEALDNRQYDRAARILREHVDKNPQDADAWFNLGLALQFAENLREAESAFLKAVQIDARNWDAWNRLGFIYEKQQQYSKSLEHYQKALALNSGSAIRESVERVQERIRRQRAGQ